MILWLDEQPNPHKIKKSLEWREFKENMLSRVERLKYSSSRCLAEVLIFQAGHVILAEYFYLLFERK